MHNKNNNKTQNYIQGLRPFSNSIPKSLRKYLKKSGYNYSNVIDNWTSIVSKKISDSCYPMKVKLGREMRNGTLTLNVFHGKEIEIEYQKNEIIDKINSFFGYNYISNISLQIVQNELNNNRKFLPKIKDLNKIQDKMKKIEDIKLKSSLNNFLKAYNENKR